MAFTGRLVISKIESIDVNLSFVLTYLMPELDKVQNIVNQSPAFSAALAYKFDLATTSKMTADLGMIFDVEKDPFETSIKYDKRAPFIDLQGAAEKDFILTVDQATATPGSYELIVEVSEKLTGQVRLTKIPITVDLIGSQPASDDKPEESPKVEEESTEESTVEIKEAIKQVAIKEVLSDYPTIDLT